MEGVGRQEEAPDGQSDVAASSGALEPASPPRFEPKPSPAAGRCRHGHQTVALGRHRDGERTAVLWRPGDAQMEAFWGVKLSRAPNCVRLHEEAVYGTGVILLPLVKSYTKLIGKTAYTPRVK